MTPITQFEAAHMSPQRFVHECWERDFTYQDYITNCDLLKFEPCSKEVFRTLYKGFDEQMAASIARRAGTEHGEHQHFASL